MYTWDFLILKTSDLQRRKIERIPITTSHKISPVSHRRR